MTIVSRLASTIKTFYQLDYDFLSLFLFLSSLAVIERSKQWEQNCSLRLIWFFFNKGELKENTNYIPFGLLFKGRGAFLRHLARHWQRVHLSNEDRSNCVFSSICRWIKWRSIQRWTATSLSIAWEVEKGHRRKRRKSIVMLHLREDRNWITTLIFIQGSRIPYIFNFPC